MHHPPTDSAPLANPPFGTPVAGLNFMHGGRAWRHLGRLSPDSSTLIFADPSGTLLFVPKLIQPDPPTPEPPPFNRNGALSSRVGGVNPLLPAFKPRFHKPRPDLTSGPNVTCFEADDGTLLFSPALRRVESFPALGAFAPNLRPTFLR